FHLAADLTDAFLHVPHTLGPLLSASGEAALDRAEGFPLDLVAEVVQESVEGVEDGLIVTQRGQESCGIAEVSILACVGVAEAGTDQPEQATELLAALPDLVHGQVQGERSIGELVDRVVYLLACDQAHALRYSLTFRQPERHRDLLPPP